MTHCTPFQPDPFCDSPRPRPVHGARLPWGHLRLPLGSPQFPPNPFQFRSAPLGVPPGFPRPPQLPLQLPAPFCSVPPGFPQFPPGFSGLTPGPPPRSSPAAMAMPHPPPPGLNELSFPLFSPRGVSANENSLPCSCPALYRQGPHYPISRPSLPGFDQSEHTLPPCLSLLSRPVPLNRRTERLANEKVKGAPTRPMAAGADFAASQ